MTDQMTSTKVTIREYPALPETALDFYLDSMRTPGAYQVYMGGTYLGIIRRSDAKTWRAWPKGTDPLDRSLIHSSRADAVRHLLATWQEANR